MSRFDDLPLNRDGLDAGSLEDITARFLAHIEIERDCPWKAGDVVLGALDDERARVERGDAPKKGLRKRLARMTLHFASAAGCSGARVRQLAEVSGAFGEADRNHPGAPWSYCRSVLRAAHREDRDPQELLHVALDAEWTVGDLAWLGRAKPVVLVLVADCETCGATLRCKLTGDDAAKAATLPALPCPVCVARTWAEGGDAKEAPRVGALEAA